MAVEFSIPSGVYDFTQRVELDGVVYGVRFRWNARASLWLLDVLSGTGEPLALGMPILAGSVPNLQHRTRTGCPTGAFVVLDNAGLGADPTASNLDTATAILYYSASEVP